MTSLSTRVHNGCTVEGYIDIAPENSFSCIVSNFQSKFSFNLSKDVFCLFDLILLRPINNISVI